MGNNEQLQDRLPGALGTVKDVAEMSPSWMAPGAEMLIEPATPLSALASVIIEPNPVPVDVETMPAGFSENSRTLPPEEPPVLTPPMVILAEPPVRSDELPAIIKAEPPAAV